jgi:phage shock protein E
MKELLFSVLILCCVAACAWTQGTKEIVVDESTVLIDVRTENEYNRGHLGKAINIPHSEIKEKIKEQVKDTETRVILYCRSGRRSGIAERTMREMGYKNVLNAGAYKRIKVKERENENPEKEAA